jgi:hypothetical protein
MAIKRWNLSFAIFLVPNEIAPHYRARLCDPIVQISKLIFINNFHKAFSELFTNGYAFIGDIDMVVFYFTQLFIVDDIRVVHPDKRRL